MSKHQMATVFVSHGAPTLLLEDIPARRFLADLGEKYRNIEAVLCIVVHISPLGDREGGRHRRKRSGDHSRLLWISLPIVPDKISCPW